MTVITALSVVYLFSNNFREIIKNQHIDANIIIALATFIAVFFSIKQAVRDRAFMNDQAVRERNFLYKMSMDSRFADMAIIVISELLTIEARRYMYMMTLHNIKMCMAQNTNYMDGNKISEHALMDAKSTTAIDLFFPKEGNKWNEVIDIMSDMASIATSTLLTYQQNDYGKRTTTTLANIDDSIKKMRELNAQLANKPMEIRIGVVDVLNAWKQKLTNHEPIS